MKNISKNLIIIIAFCFTTLTLSANTTNTVKLLDAKVSVNQGKSNYDFNIQTPKGINGFKPNLSINYTSQEGNDILGLDTSLHGISSINRCGEKPIFNNYDAFCLDKEPIVKIKDKENEYTLLNNHSYKLIKYGGLDDNEYWEVYKPTGEVLTYGKDDNTKVKVSFTHKFYNKYGSNYENKSYIKPIIWNIQNKKDKNNNEIKYTYDLIDGYSYIKSIEYNHNKISFNYENRNDKLELINKYKNGLIEINKQENGAKFKIEYPSSYAKISKRIKSLNISTNNTRLYNYNFSYIYANKSLAKDENSLLSSISFEDSNNNTIKPINFKYKIYLDDTNDAISNSDNMQQIYLLNEVINSYGIEKNIKYSFYNNDDINKDDNIYNVESLNIDMPDGGLKTLTYTYNNHKYINEQHNYSSVEMVDSLTGIKITTTYSQKEESLNKPLREIKRLNNIIISDIEFEYETLKEKNIDENRVLLNKKTTKKYDLKGNKLSTLIIDYNYNEYDNITKETTNLVSNNLNYKSTKTIQYLNDTSKWIISSPTNITITNMKKENKKKYNSSITTKYTYDSKGNIDTKIIAYGTSLALTTKYTYKSNGLLKTTTIGNRTTTNEYDSYNRVIKSTNAKGFDTIFEYEDDICTNKPTSITDINNQTTSYEYDSLCNKAKVTESNGRVTEILYDNEDIQINLGVDYQKIGFDSLIGLKSIYSKTTRTNTGLWSKKYYNRFGKVIRNIKMGSNDKKIFVDTIYNKKGKIKAKTAPYFEGDIINQTNYTQYEYDILNRVVKIKKPKTLSSTRDTLYTYDGYKTTIKNPNNKVKIIYKNALGKIIKVQENDSTILYGYDANLNLIFTTDKPIVNSYKIKIQPVRKETHIILITYDILNRKISLNDPSIGLISYEYNKYNNLIKQTNAKGEVTSMQYDKLGRITSKNINGVENTYEYDTALNGIGKLAYTSNENSYTTYEYDDYGRLLSKIKTINNQEFQTTYAYNSNNQVTNTVHPSDTNIKKTYDVNGFLQKISIAKKDIWDFDTLALEKSLKATLLRIAELERTAIKYEKNAKNYMAISNKYKIYATSYSNTSNNYKKEVDTLNKVANSIQKSANDYQSMATKYRQKANYYYKAFGRVSLHYIKTVNGRHYYSNNDCIHRNWKGRCTSRRNYSVSIPSWMVGNEKYWVPGNKWKGTSGHWGSRPQRNINVGDTYNKWANYYQNKATKTQNEANNKYATIKEKQKEVDKYKNLANSANNTAKKYASMAREQVNLVSDVTSELKNQIKAQKALEKSLAQKRSDDTDVYLYEITSRDAFGRIEGELFGNGLLTLNTYDSITGQLKSIRTGMGNKYIRNLNYTYDDMNNVLSRNDNITGEYESYTYDDYDRLKTWNNGSNTLTYNYDIFGNLKNNSYNMSMVYNSKNQIIKKI